jgi:glycerophosphoryl diester phosphodiesterase
MVITTKSGMTLFYKPDAMALQLPMESAGLNLTRKRIIKQAHKRKMAIHYWTINNKEDMKLLIENGADGLITDRPDLMNEVLNEMGF